MRRLMPPLRVSVAAVYFAVLTALSFLTWNPLDGFFAPAPFLLCFVCAIALERALRHQQLILAVYVIQSGLAYSFDSMRASHKGAHLLGMTPSALSVDMGLLLAAAFVAVVTTTAVALRGKRPPTVLGTPPPRDTWTWIALVTLLAACFIAAIRSGMWTAYLGGTVEQQTGGVRLELLYSTVLTASVMLLWQEIIERWAAGRRSRHAAAFQWSLLGTLLVLQFLLQGRRYMITSLVFVALLAIRYARLLKSALRRPSRRVLVVGVTATILWGTFFGSNLWRQAAAAYGETDISIATRVRMMGTEGTADVSSGFSDRMTYLTLNASAFEYYNEANRSMKLHRMALSSVVTALPGSLFPWKYEASGAAETERCEDAFRLISSSDDLPCTPEVEAFLAGGPVGVVFVGVLWGAFFAVLVRLTALRGVVWRFAALVGFVPMSLIEASAFPMVQSLREMLIAGGLVWACTALVRRRASATKTASVVPNV